MSQKSSGAAKGIGAGLILASAGLMAFLGVWEPGADPGLVYADKLAGGLPTVCRGITRHVTTTPIIVGERWSKEKCERHERAAVAVLQTRLLRCFTRIPPQSVFDAASSHGWNVGAAATCGSQAMRAWNAGDWALGCRRLAYSDSGRRVWAFAGGKLIRGLARRRDAEVAYCMKDVR